MILLCYILSVFCGASGDALHHKGKKKTGHLLQFGEAFFLLALFIASLFANPFYSQGQIIGIAVSYFGIRFLLFDFIWNIFSGQKLSYIGNTSYYDKLLRKINPYMIPVLKLMAGVLSITYLLL